MKAFRCSGEAAARRARSRSASRSARRCALCAASAARRSLGEGPDQSILDKRQVRYPIGERTVFGQSSPRATVSAVRAWAISRPVQRVVSIPARSMTSHTAPMWPLGAITGAAATSVEAARCRFIGRGFV